MRKLVKYDGTGKLLWEKKISNTIINQFPASNSYIKRNKNGSISSSCNIFSIDIFENNCPIIGHAGGGCIYDEKGNLKKLLVLKENIDGTTVDLGLNVKIRNNIVMNVSLKGREIFIYKLMEEKL